MVYKRKAPAGRRPRRKFARKAPRVPRRVMMGTMNVTRTFWTANWSPDATTTNNFWRYLTMNISSLGWATELATVFDSYKMNAVKFVLRPKFDNYAGNDTTDTTVPGITANGLTNVHIINDPTSTLVPTGVYSTGNLNSFLENGRVKSYQGTRPISIYIKNPTYTQTLATGITSRSRSRWVNFNTGGQSIAYGGAHVYMQDANFSGVFNQSFDIFVTVYMQVKGLA